MKIRPGPDWSEIELAELEYMKGQIIRGRGQSIEAETSFLKIVELLEPKILSNPEIYHFYPLLAGSYTGLGQHEEAVELCRSGLANDKIARDNMSSTRLRYELAVALVKAGKHDEAMVIMEELLGCPSTLNMGRLKTDPAWDPLRDQPRFQKLIADNP